MKIILKETDLSRMEEVLKHLTAPNSDVYENPMATIGLDTAKKFWANRKEVICSYVDNMGLEIEIESEFGNTALKPSEVLQIIANSIQ